MPGTFGVQIGKYFGFEMICGYPEKVSRSFPGTAGDTRLIRWLRDDITNFLGNMEVVRQFGCKHN